MKREIKFRVWDEPNQCWSDYCHYIGEDGTMYHDINAIDEPDQYIVEQYTGLKDKNGKEIYEGDIVKQFVCGVKMFKGKPCGRHTIWQVRWNEDECCFELYYLSGSLFGDSMMANGEEYEVVGNIHENPELFKEDS